MAQYGALRAHAAGEIRKIPLFPSIAEQKAGESMFQVRFPNPDSERISNRSKPAGCRGGALFLEASEKTERVWGRKTDVGWFV